MMTFQAAHVDGEEHQPAGGDPFSGVRPLFGSPPLLAEEVHQQTFTVHCDMLMHISPVVSAAIAGGFRESVSQEIDLPQFKPKDFELFLCLVQAVSFSIPPHIPLPKISNTLVMAVVPIAAYLGCESMLTMLEAHVQLAATIATVLVFEDCKIPVTWSTGAFMRLFTELTTKTATPRTISKRCIRLVKGGEQCGREVSVRVEDAAYKVTEVAKELLRNRFSEKTLFDFLTFVIEHKVH